MEKSIKLMAMLILLLASCKQSHKQNIAAVKTAILSYEKALTSADLQAVMDVYADDGIFMPQHSIAQVGKEAISKAYRHVFANLQLDIKFIIHDIEVNENTAWVRTSSPGKIKVKALGKWEKETNNELFILKKRSNRWKIFRYIFSTTKPRT